MRSRYSAYVLGRETYLLDTWHPDTRPETVSLTADQRWLGLKIRSTRSGGEDDEEGTVEFIARFKIAGRGHRLHEISTFRRLAGRWHYLDGVRGDTDSSRREDGRNGTETDYL
jgi:SEC-C motif-containing protein